MLTFLNNRCIYDYRINKGIEDAYKDYLPPLRYPFCIVDLSLDPSLVDVNVHPTKKEVRISMEEEIARDVKDEVLKTLNFRKPIYFASQDEKSEKLLGDETFDVSDIQKSEQEDRKTNQDYSNVLPIQEPNYPTYVQDSLPIEPTYESHSPIIQPTKKEEQKPVVETTPSSEKPQASFSGEDYYNTILQKEPSSYKLPEMHPIGQVLQTYILCDGIDCFYILDQHAAAERINYEKTTALFASIRSRIVPLFPLVAQLSPKEIVNFDEEHISRLASLGIICENFGNNSIKITEIPSFLNEKNDEEVILDCVHSCLNNEASDPLSLLHLTIANIACKKSIKANHIMSSYEMEALLKDLSKCKNPANCPHGRPTIIKITRADVEKIFRRSGF